MTGAIELSETSHAWEGLAVSGVARSPAAARIVAQLPPRADRAGLELWGEVDGPFCAHTRTLRSRAPLEPYTGAEGPLASAHIVEPCFWSGELPFLYQVELELRRGREVVARTSRELGIRPLGVVKAQIVSAGTPVVWRAVDPRAVRGRPTLEAWRDSNTVLLAQSPDAALCAACSRSGVLLLADFRDGSAPGVNWTECARYPAVQAVIFPSSLEAAPAWPPGGPLRVIDSRAPEVPPNRACEAWHAEFDAIEPAAWRRYQAEQAGLLSRIIEPCASLDEARGRCDRLQRDAAERGQFAGYLARARAGRHD